MEVEELVEVVEEVEEVVKVVKEVTEYAGLVRELAVLAPMLAVQLRLQSVQSMATVSVPPTDLEDRSVARALETPGLLIMEEEEDVEMEVVEVRTM